MGRQGMPGSEQLLPGREASMAVAARHAVLDTPMIGPFAEHLQEIYFGLGCFWGAERLFWGLEGVFTTAAGYAGGLTPNPSYEEVCSGRTGHTEVVMVVYDPARISLITLLRQFWESHDPTQGMRQGNDLGTQYRSAIYTTGDTQHAEARASGQDYGKSLKADGFGSITTEIETLQKFYYARRLPSAIFVQSTQWLLWPGWYRCVPGITGCEC